MTEVVAEEMLEDAIYEMNKWHPRTPLYLVFSKQEPGEEGEVSGSSSAVAEVYNDLFGLDKIGISDEARNFHLKLSHGNEARGYAFGEKVKSEKYGKGYQRTIKDTLTDYGLERIGTGEYRLEPNFPEQALEYLENSAQLDISDTLDLKPLVLWYYWDDVEDAETIGDLWNRFCERFGTDEPPFDEMFTCTNLGQEIQKQQKSDYSIKGLVLPQEYGSGELDPDFWNRFRNALINELEDLDWEGPIPELAAKVTSGLMSDQSIFLLGPPGTGKTTIVNDAILPALREAYSGDGEPVYSDFTMTPESTQSDLLGFQGLDGDWVMGPVGDSILYEADGQEDQEADDEDEDEEEDTVSVDAEAIPHLLFLDEANRVNIENVLSPLQGPFDRMRQGKEPGLVTLGQQDYIMPRRVLRVFAGNSPAQDTGLKEQSRAFKRRISVMPMPDYLENVITDRRRFPALVRRRLDALSQQDDVSISQPATELRSSWEENEEPMESLRLVLEEVRDIPDVPVTIGLLEAILLRTATHYNMERSDPLDAALTQTLIGMMGGDADQIEDVVEVAEEQRLTQFKEAIESEVLDLYEGQMVHDLNPIL